MSYVFNFYAGIPSEGVNITSPPSRPRAIRARSEENSARRHHRHRRHRRHRSRSRNEPQRREIPPPAVAPRQRPPVPTAAPAAAPPGDWHIAPDATPFRGSPPPFVQHPPPRSDTPHQGEPPPRAKSAPAGRSPTPGFGFTSGCMVRWQWATQKPGALRSAWIMETATTSTSGSSSRFSF